MPRDERHLGLSNKRPNSSLIKHNNQDPASYLLDILVINLSVDIDPKDSKKVTDILEKNSVHYDDLGKIIDKDMIINSKTKLTIDELKAYNNNWLINYMS